MALFNNFPYSNTEEINLDYTLNKLNELYSRGENLYTELQSWKTATDEANEAWKSDLLSDINEWQNSVTHSLEEWKNLVDSEVANALTSLSNQITAELTQAKADLRNEVADLASAAAASASDAAASQSAAAQSAQTAVNSAAAAALSEQNITASAEQINTNKNDIIDLSLYDQVIQTEIEYLHNELINYDYVDGTVSRQEVYNRQGVMLIVNGTTPNANQSRLKLSGAMQISTTLDGVRSWTGGIALTQGSKYRVRYKLIAGTVSPEGDNSPPVLSVYPIGAAESIGEANRVDATEFNRTFIAPADPVNLCFFSARNTSYVNAVYLITLEKVNINTNITPYISPLNVALYGDSICRGTITSGVYADVDFSTYISTELDYACDNYAVGGTGYCKRSDITNIYDAVLANGVNYGALVLFAGTNDYGYNKQIGDISDAASDTSNSTFYASLKYLIDYIITNNPNCQIMIVTPIFRNYHSSGGVGDTYTTIQNTVGATLGDYCEALINIGRLYNIPVYDSRDNSAVNIDNYADKLTETSSGSNHYLHPTNNSYPIIYKKIVKWINTII